VQADDVNPTKHGDGMKGIAHGMERGFVSRAARSAINGASLEFLKCASEVLADKQLR